MVVELASSSYLDPPPYIPYQHSFAHFGRVLMDAPRAPEFQIIPPRSSAIVKQLNVIDKLMSSQFKLVDKPKVLLPGHMAALNSICKRFINLYGPLHPFYRNCAFRKVELEAFLELLTKYNTEIDFAAIVKSSRARAAFCTQLVSDLRRLSSLVHAVIYEFASQIHYSQTDVRFVQAALRPFTGEYRDLERVVDVIDWDLTEHCRSGTTTKNESIDTVNTLINNFLRLTFL